MLHWATFDKLTAALKYYDFLQHKLQYTHHLETLHVSDETRATSRTTFSRPNSPQAWILLLLTSSITSSGENSQLQPWETKTGLASSNVTRNLYEEFGTSDDLTFL